MNIIIAGGGTGGHLFPGIAIAEAFIKKDPNNRVLFISTGRPVELSILGKAGFPHRCITAEGIKGRGLWNQIISLSKLPKGIFESFQILRDFKANLVIGVGSYSAGPVVITAWLMGIPIFLHEQNIIPGITNQVLSYFAKRVYVSYENTRIKANPKKIVVTGNPIRKAIKQPTPNSQHLTPKSQEPTPLFTILIIGGSQGAHAINMAMIETLKHIWEKEKFFFIHQTGNQDIKEVQQAYEKQNIPCLVQPFFDDMASQYEKADLMICRAGATTVAEITVIGKAAIFIPFPFAADNHQVLNAESLVNQGAAEMILQKELTGETLAQRIEYYASNPDALEFMAAQAKKFGKPDAAEAIVADCSGFI